MESHEDVMQNGCVSRGDIVQTTLEAIRIGLSDREQDRLAMEEVDAVFERYRPLVEPDVDSFLL